MQENHTFKIYNASAGSGKTYTLVKSYLKILLSSKRPEAFKYILAITFTNKAVSEMKGRIIDTLKLFSDASILKNPDSMFISLCEDLNMQPEVLHKKAKGILETIIYNYAAFDVSTIDGFTHKLIRTFAYDLKLPLNFEVELDQNSLLTEAVDSLIAKAGTDNELTKILVDFAIEKADDDKSWDVSNDFNKIAKLLVNENDIPFIEKLKDKTLGDFKTLKGILRKEILETETVIVKNAKTVLNSIENAGLQFTDFTRGTLPNHFKKASELDLNRLYDNKLEENISERKSIYNKTASPEVSNIIDSLLPEIEVLYKTVKAHVFHLKFLKAFYKNVTPLSVLNEINNELKLLKEDQNKMLISEFNTIISNEIKDQPTPFIYERIGEKFKHYFIDEFQDTSVKQWENLIPLLNNVLSTEGGSAMLVGDAKQAIYRWRGGKAEQFIGLCNNENPLNAEKDVAHLPSNYRSFKEIVTFNNGLFKYLSNTVFNHPDYADLYQNSHQEISKTKNGYVELSFLDIEKDDDRNEVFSEAVLKTINTCIANGFELGDITVLIRKKKEGVAIANFLSTKGISIVSSETLLIANSQEVRFINNLLALLLQPNNNEIKIKVLEYLSNRFNIEDEHQFFSEHLNLSLTQLFKQLQAYNVFLTNNLLQLPLYDLVETIVRAFNLVPSSHAYVQYYLDTVLDFYQKKGSDIAAFLDYFDKKKESLSIISPEGQNAVQIMTIHKSKGLEFPVVIFPFADLDVYQEIEPKEWISINEEKYAGFSNTLLNFNSDFEHFGTEGLQIFNAHKAEQELDNINLLYVALTRAEEQLYIISKNDSKLKEESKAKKYSGLLINYLQHLNLWNDSENSYSFGNPKRESNYSMHEQLTSFQNSFISNAKETLNIKVVTKSGMLWDTQQQEAIEKGNLIHDIMAQIKTKDDIDFVFTDFLDASIINNEQSEPLRSIVSEIIEHPKLKDYFTTKYTIYNERDIITENGTIFRPDRLVIDDNKNSITIIDYKTGDESQNHVNQLNNYQNILTNMGYLVKEKVLVYTNKHLLIKTF
ncbi:UvrD-helicase domain-containing protein [Algibacter sp. 2305UL17-15]|uniref:UvrD-helicase domain-containing protein n=1 Tax=Algibacter sp. 2305UL17-15 TaxID=3231268 RepID=UPI003457860D